MKQSKSEQQSDIPTSQVLDKLSKKQLLELAHRLFKVNNDLVLRNAELLEVALKLQQEKHASEVRWAAYVKGVVDRLEPFIKDEDKIK